MSKIDWTEWILEKNAAAEAEELKKSDFVEVESLEKAKGIMYFAGERGGKEKRFGGQKGRGGRDANIEHFHYDVNVSHEQNMKDAQEHFAKQNHPYAKDTAKLATYLNGRKAEAEKEAS